MLRLNAQESKSVPHLSRREQQVLNLLRDGLSNKEIAVRLGIAPTTVSQYLHVLFIKLGVQNRTQLALRYR
jgi:two-component system, NarL family, nitrate/nitrite response regulator NarL